MPSLVEESSAAGVGDFRDALEIDPDSLSEQWVPPSGLRFTLALYGNDPDPLTTVKFVYPRFIHWPPWGFAARLTRPEALQAWLTERGWKTP